MELFILKNPIYKHYFFLLLSNKITENSFTWNRDKEKPTIKDNVVECLAGLSASITLTRN